MTDTHNSEDPRAALDAAIDANTLINPHIFAQDGREFLLIPDDYKATDISDPHRLPPRPKSAVILDESASLISYINRFNADASLIVADYDKMKMTAYLDWHHHNDHMQFGEANACQHTATLQLIPSEEFTRWNAFEGELHTQRDFAEFLEENSRDIAMPAAAVMMEIARDLEAETGSKFKSRTRLQNGDVTFVYETDTRVTNEVVVPDRFTVMIPLYNGEQPEMLTCIFRYRATAQGLVMGFGWHRVEYQRRAHFTQVAAAVAEATGVLFVQGRVAV
jgi:uncharacterized protein YfdQ (DUF2303 family)